MRREDPEQPLHWIPDRSRACSPWQRARAQPLTCSEHVIGHVPFISLFTLLPCRALISSQAQFTRVSLFPWDSCGSRQPWGGKKDILACCTRNPDMQHCTIILCTFKVKQLQTPNTQHTATLGQQCGHRWRIVFAGGSDGIFLETFDWNNKLNRVLDHKRDSLRKSRKKTRPAQKSDPPHRLDGALCGPDLVL